METEIEAALDRLEAAYFEGDEEAVERSKAEILAIERELVGFVRRVAFEGHPEATDRELLNKLITEACAKIGYRPTLDKRSLTDHERAEVEAFARCLRERRSMDVFRDGTACVEVLVTSDPKTRCGGSLAEAYSRAAAVTEGETK